MSSSPKNCSEKCFRFDVSRAMAIRQGKIKPGERQRQSGLTRIQHFRTDIFQIFIVGPDQKRKLGNFKSMAPASPQAALRLPVSKFLSTGKSQHEKKDHG